MVGSTAQGEFYQNCGVFHWEHLAHITSAGITGYRTTDNSVWGETYTSSQRAQQQMLQEHFTDHEYHSAKNPLSTN